MDLDSRAYYKLIRLSYRDENSDEYIRIVDALGPLAERYDHEIPEMLCSHIRDPFRKILEENPRILSKNGFITIYGKLYESDSKVHGYPSNYIYCSICDFLVFIPGEYTRHSYRNQDNHLKKCISRNTILNEYARRKEILQSIDTREFQIWQYKQYILKEEVKMKHLQLELLSQSIPHSEKDKLASVSYAHDVRLTDYKIYVQSKATIAKNTMPAYIANAPEISSRTSSGDLAEAYFDSVQKNAGRK